MATRKKLNRNISSIAPSATLKIAAKARAMAAEGHKIYSLAAGEPDFGTPAHIVQAAVEALERGETKYSPAAGIMELREEIAAKLARENGLKYEASQIVVSNGAKQSLFNAILSICRDDDEVIVPAPYWLSYPEMIKVAGAKMVMVPTCIENAYKMSADDLEMAITEKAKAVILNTPSNPTGTVYLRRELEDIVKVCLEHNLYIIADEIYEKILYDEFEHVSIASLSQEVSEQTITINGFSKAYAMTGWRLGYLAGPHEVVSCIQALQSHSTSGPNTFAQHGAIAALKGDQSCVSEFVRAFAERRELLYERLAAIDEIKCPKPQGAFYMLADITAFGMDSLEFAETFLEKEGVAVIPGVPFGSNGSIRVSYACDTDTINGAIDRLQRFIKTL